jgi:hypothetical protein
MAYKSKSKNTSRLTRTTRTQNSNGGSSVTNSVKTGGSRGGLSTRISQTQKSNGTSYTTLTTRDGNGYITRKRIHSSAQSKKAYKAGKGGNSALGLILLGAMFALAMLQALIS